MKVKFTERLIELVYGADLPFYKVEREIGLGNGTLRRVIGNGCCNTMVLAKICDYFKVDANWLIGLVD